MTAPRKVWEVEARQGDAPWHRYLFASKARAEQAAADYARTGNTVSGPRAVNVY
jgi:hypothetical protein